MSEQQASTAPIAVLLVESDPVEGARLCSMLESSEFHCFEVDGTSEMEEALVMLRGRPYDAVLLDLAGPEGNDLQLLMLAKVATANTPPMRAKANRKPGERFLQRYMITCLPDVTRTATRSLLRL